MVLVTKEQFYAMIGPLERLDTGATMHHHPEKTLRWQARQWQNGGYKLMAYTETFLDRPYPHPENHYVDQSLVDQFITF